VFWIVSITAFGPLLKAVSILLGASETNYQFAYGVPCRALGDVVHGHGICASIDYPPELLAQFIHQSTPSVLLAVSSDLGPGDFGHWSP